MRATILLFGLLVFSVSIHLPSNASGPQPPSITEEESAKIASEVRQEFLHAWNGYKQYAWGHDDLKPLSKTIATGDAESR
jgi:hypothetical protein